MVLVVGATGLVGLAVCEKLMARGERVRALVRETSSPDKLDALRSAGAELQTGDLKNPESLQAACRGAGAVVSTASSSLSRQAGDSIESVDAAGQLNLVNAARDAGVNRFVFVSFRHSVGPRFPIADAKAQVENAIRDLDFTVIQASWFMEVWLSAALGFDYAGRKARIYGSGSAPVSWVSFRDVATMCAVALRHPAASRRIIEFGGPEALSPLEVVARFEKIGGRPFQVEHVPEAALLAQFEAASDPLQKSFLGLMLRCAGGDAMEMGPVAETFGLELTSLESYARAVLGALPAPEAAERRQIP